MDDPIYRDNHAMMTERRWSTDTHGNSTPAARISLPLSDTEYHNNERRIKVLINDAHVWVAYFQSEDALEEYMAEQYDEDDDDAPISKFAADQGESFYDHDLVYAQFHDSPTARKLIEGWSFPDDSVAVVAEKISQLNVPTANTCFVADKDEFSNPKSVKGDGYDLWYVGNFEGCSM